MTDLDRIPNPAEGTVDDYPALIDIEAKRWYPLPSKYRLYRFLDGAIKVRDISPTGYDNVFDPIWQPIPVAAKVEINLP